MVDDGINTSNNNNNNPEGEDREINLYAVFFKYMVYWPWFVASVLACCIGMYVFLKDTLAIVVVLDEGVTLNSLP